MHPEITSESSRARALIAIGALAALGILIAVVLLATSGSGPEHEFAAPPQECIDRWNNDEQAVATGVHNSVSPRSSIPSRSRRPRSTSRAPGFR
jgi:hypothetical protein